jgi:hypothetical protein
MATKAARALLPSLARDGQECPSYRILCCFAVAVMTAAVANPAASTAQSRRSVCGPDPATMSENDLVAMVPTQGPDATCACPACAKYVEWSWSAAKPNENRTSSTGSSAC